MKNHVLLYGQCLTMSKICSPKPRGLEVPNSLRYSLQQSLVWEAGSVQNVFAHMSVPVCTQLSALHGEA